MMCGFVMPMVVMAVVMVMRRWFAGRMMFLCCKGNAGQGQEEYNS
jgi:hypothetical protein